MRLFVALRPPSDAVRELDAALAPARAAHPRVLWTDPRDWHVTLAFLGEVPDDRHERLPGSLERAAGRSPGFPLRLAGSGQFSSRVLWTGLDGNLAALRRLAGESRAAADEVGIDRDRRSFRAHLTIGHGWRHQRGSADETAADETAAEIAALSKELAAFRGTEWNAGRLWLMSVRPRQSPRYEALGGWELSG